MRYLQPSPLLFHVRITSNLDEILWKWTFIKSSKRVPNHDVYQCCLTVCYWTYFNSRKCISKFYVQNVSHFIPASIYQLQCGALIMQSNFSKILTVNSIARPLGWDMGCLLWVQTLIYIPLQSLYSCLQYHAILVCIIMHSTVSHQLSLNLLNWK